MPDGTSSSCSPAQHGDDTEITSVNVFTKAFAKHGKVWFARSIWSQCRATQKGRQFTNDMWRDEVLKGLKTFNGFCSFSFRRHSVTLCQGKKIRSLTVFRCEGYCKFSTCDVTFNCQVTRDLRLLVKFKGEIHHLLSEKSSRYITGAERESLKTTLKNKLPRLHYLEKLSELDAETRQSGCRDSCPSKAVLKKIRYESRKIKTPHDNVWLSLEKIKEEQCKCSLENATLQVIMLDPPGAIFYSKRSMEILHAVCKRDILYIDATGGVILGQERCYAYELVIRHPIQGNPPFAAATLISWSHNIPSISHFINTVWNAQRKLFPARSFPPLVMCDGSMALINAIIISLFKESLRSYLLRCWEIVTGKRNTSFVHEPFLHLCASHFMKNAKRLVRKT